MWEKIKPYLLPYGIGIAIPLTVGILSAFLTRGGMEIYGQIQTPPLSPPSWLFPIAWSILYVLMGISSATVYIKRERNYPEARRGLLYYAVSLVFNFFWSIIFFNGRVFMLAFLWLILLLSLIILTVLSYRKVDKFSAYLQIPYILWVIFAGYLNFGIWFLNR